MQVETAAILFVVLIGIVMVFQLALAAGAPWGSLAMGGKFPGKMPPPMRVSALVQIGVLALLAAIVGSKSGLWLSGWQGFADSAIWGVVAFSFLATVLNLITRSVWERRIWAPVAIMMLVTSIIVALQ